MRVGFVCEGQTDIPMFEALLNERLPDGWIPTYLAPERDALGDWSSAGWTKVRAFCRSYGSYVAYLPNAPVILIVQVDGDIRGHVKAADNEALCRTVKSWLGDGASFPGLVIVIPTEATETWLLAANSSANPAIEAAEQPAAQLVKLGLIGSDANGKLYKDAARYRELAGALGQKLVGELNRFCSKIEALVPDPSSASPAAGQRAPS